MEISTISGRKTIAHHVESVTSVRKCPRSTVVNYNKHTKVYYFAIS